jgi:hypothetical protein
MTTMLEDFLFSHPDVTLSNTRYGENFHLGSGASVMSSPVQRLRSFVENEGSPYRFFVVGRLTSFKVIEDVVGSPRLWLLMYLCSYTFAC